MSHVNQTLRTHITSPKLVKILGTSLHNLRALDRIQATKRPVQHTTQDIAGAQPQQMAMLGVAEDGIDAALDEEVGRGQQAEDASAVLEEAADAADGEGRAPELNDGGEAEGARDDELHVAHLAHLVAERPLDDTGLERHRCVGLLVRRWLRETMWGR